ncbi:MAG: hypothetical protein JWP37_2489 [Mucilaginibacter sp.]|nr:hypothetical protein [Mucilaginibacter sp.]
MKLSHFIIGICLIFTCFANAKGVMAQEGKASVKISETGNVYRFKAKYDKTKTKRVQEYMTERLKSTGFKFTNTQLDAKLALTGGINFYIKSYGGELEMKFDKRKNTADDFTMFKKICDGIKDIVEKD